VSRAGGTLVVRSQRRKGRTQEERHARCDAMQPALAAWGGYHFGPGGVLVSSQGENGRSLCGRLARAAVFCLALCFLPREVMTIRYDAARAGRGRGASLPYPVLSCLFWFGSRRRRFSSAGE
jgi:hypothetical protein